VKKKKKDGACFSLSVSRRKQFLKNFWSHLPSEKKKRNAVVPVSREKKKKNEEEEENR